MLLAQTRLGPNILTDILMPLLPWLLIFGFIWFFIFRKVMRQTKKTIESLDRTQAHQAEVRAHQANVEAKLDRLIELTEQRNRTGQ